MSAADDLRACDVVRAAIQRHETAGCIPSWQAEALATATVAALLAAGWTLTPPSKERP